MPEETLEQVEKRKQLPREYIKDKRIYIPPESTGGDIKCHKIVCSEMVAMMTHALKIVTVSFRPNLFLFYRKANPIWLEPGKTRTYHNAFATVQKELEP